MRIADKGLTKRTGGLPANSCLVQHAMWGCLSSVCLQRTARWLRSCIYNLFQIFPECNVILMEHTATWSLTVTFAVPGFALLCQQVSNEVGEKVYSSLEKAVAPVRKSNQGKCCVACCDRQSLSYCDKCKMGKYV